MRKIGDWWRKQTPGTQITIIGVIATMIGAIAALYPVMKSETYSFIGSVVDEFGEPILDAVVVVVIEGKSEALRTDDAGKFTFSLSERTFILHLEIAKAGYAPAKKRFSLVYSSPLIPEVVLISATKMKKEYDSLKSYANALTANYNKQKKQLFYQFTDFASYKQAGGKLYIKPYNSGKYGNTWQHIVEQWLTQEIALYFKNAESIENGVPNNIEKETLIVKVTNKPETLPQGVEVAIHLRYKAFSELILAATLNIPFCLVNFSELYINNHSVPDISITFENDDVILEKKATRKMWFMIPKGSYKITGRIGQLEGFHEPIEFSAFWRNPLKLVSTSDKRSPAGRLSSTSCDIALLDPNYYHIGDNEYTVKYWNAYNKLLQSIGENPLPEHVRGNPRLAYSYDLNWISFKKKYRISETKRIIKAFIQLKVYLLKPRRSAPAIIAINDRPLRFLNDFVRQEETPTDIEIEIPTDILTEVFSKNQCKIIITVFDDTVESLDYDKREDFIFKSLSLKFEYTDLLAVN